MNEKYYFGKANFWDFCISSSIIVAIMVTGKFLINLAKENKNKKTTK